MTKGMPALCQSNRRSTACRVLNSILWL